MRIVVADSQVPFVTGGAELLAANLVAALRTAGHEVSLVTLPFRWFPPDQALNAVLAARLVDLSASAAGPVDRVIALRFPATCVRHPDKVVWLLHQHREAYDLWGTPYGSLAAVPGGEAVRSSIVRADREFLGEARRVYTISRNVSGRLRRFNGIDSTPLYHPPPDHASLRPGDGEDFLFFPSRIAPLKRQDLAVEAMRHAPPGLRLVVAGGAESPADADRLARLVVAAGVADRVTLLGAVSRQELLDLYARCRAVVFTPFDEDYGYVTLEAFYAGKPVLTCTDSGGPLEFVRDGETGVVAEPSPGALGEAIGRLDHERARRLGHNARDLVDSLDLSWARVVAELLG